MSPSSGVPDGDLPDSACHGGFHPDRLAATLASRGIPTATDSVTPADGAEPAAYREPGRDAADARVDWKLLQARVDRAIAVRGTDAARLRIEQLAASPDLLAGTAQDACMRGVRVAYEEAESLCKPLPPAADLDRDGAEPKATSIALPAALKTEVLEGRDLKRRREFVVRSGGAHVRISRKLGITLADRKRDLVAEDCLRFDDRHGDGDLDTFRACEERRPRVFLPSFLSATRLEQSEAGMRLVLRGRLGRRPTGFPCELVLEGRADESHVVLRVRVRNDHHDHRLRIRFARGAEDYVRHAGTPHWTRVHTQGNTFVCATLLRATGQLRTSDTTHIATPDAQCLGWVEHTFALGGDTSIADDPRAQAWLAPQLER